MTNTETTETDTGDLSSSDRTKLRILDAAIDVAERDGLDGVQFKTVATAAGLTTHSLVTYHFGKAESFRRAVAMEIVRRGHDTYSSVPFSEVEITVDELVDIADSWTDDNDVVDAVIYPAADVVLLAEAYVWLVRNGTTT